MVSFRTLPFRFRLEMVNPAFVTFHNTEQKITAFLSISLQQTYGNDAANSHLTMPFWLLDEGDILGGDGSKPEQTNNGGFCSRWNRLKESQTVEMYGRLHSDICNVPLFFLNGVKIQIKLTKAKKSFYFLSNRADAKASFKFLEDLVYVKRIRPAPSSLASHNEALLAGYPARYNFTSVELKTFTFSGGSQCLTINNAVLGLLPKRLLFTMVMNTTFSAPQTRTPSNSDTTF